MIRRLATLLFLAPTATALQTSGECPHQDYERLSKVGYQPDAETSTTCGETSMTISVTISAGGEIVVADADATGAISVEIATPSECKTQKLHYSGEVNGCKPPGSGYCNWCDHDAAKVNVKLYQNDSPCPSLPPADLLGLLGGARNTITNGVPITIPCGTLKDVTNEAVDPGSRVLNSARLVGCADCDPPAQSGRPDAGTYFSEGGATHFLYQGKLNQLDMDAVLSGTERLAEAGVADLDPSLVSHLTSESPGALPPVLQQVRNQQGTLEWVDDIVCEVQTMYPVDVPGFEGITRRSFAVLGDLRAGGDFSVRLPELIEGEADEVFAFTEHWASLSGDVYFAEEGEPAGTIYPARNSSDSLPYSTRLWFISELRAWLENPYRIYASDAMEFSISEEGGGILRITQEINWSYAEGVPETPAAQWLLGGRTEFTVNTNGANPMVTKVRRVDAAGTYVDYEFEGQAAIRGTAKRPTTVNISSYAVDESLIRRTTITVTSLDRVSTEPSNLSLPQPIEDAWFIRVE